MNGLALIYIGIHISLNERINVKVSNVNVMNFPRCASWMTFTARTFNIWSLFSYSQTYSANVATLNKRRVQRPGSSDILWRFMTSYCGVSSDFGHSQVTESHNTSLHEKMLQCLHLLFITLCYNSGTTWSIMPKFGMYLEEARQPNVLH